MKDYIKWLIAGMRKLRKYGWIVILQTALWACFIACLYFDCETLGVISLLTIFAQLISVALYYYDQE